MHAALFDEPGKPDLLWLATAPMREELARVLAYPHIAVRLVFHGLRAALVLSQFDARARIVPVPSKAPATCTQATASTTKLTCACVYCSYFC